MKEQIPPPTSPRLYVESNLAAGSVVTVSPEQAHYMLHVMRMKAGDEVRLFNGRNGEWQSIVATISKRTVDINIQKQTRMQKAMPDLWLCCAPIKKAHFDIMIEKATELGVGVIQPLLTARTQIREVNIERCGAIAIEAAEQAGRLNIPEIKNPMKLLDLTARWPQDRALIVCAEWGDAVPVRDAFAAPPLKAGEKAGIVTGPEGGFTADELEMLRRVSGAYFIRLGPRILRADTAAMAAITCWQALCGDWQDMK